LSDGNDHVLDGPIHGVRIGEDCDVVRILDHDGRHGDLHGGCYGVHLHGDHRDGRHGNGARLHGDPRDRRHGNGVRFHGRHGDGRHCETVQYRDVEVVRYHNADHASHHVTSSGRDWKGRQRFVQQLEVWVR